MSNISSEDLNKSLYVHVEDNKHLYPLMARSWRITVMKNTDVERPTVLISKSNAKLTHSYPFYKPYSRVIEMSDIK